MRLLSTLLTALSLLFPLVPAALIISLPTTHVGLPSSDHASLAALSSHLTAPLTRQSTFSFSSSSLKPSTSYLLDIHSRVYNFASYRVDVDASGQVEGVWETFRGGEWGNKGPDVMVKGEEGGDTRVEVRFVGKREYYEGRGSCEYSTFLSFFLPSSSRNETLERREYCFLLLILPAEIPNICPLC
jgi:ER membrane protein complex subunit 7